ncbi:poly-beta-1,6 N-acetyl-D-glucosamine export porin PgaA [Acinetobacter sp.]|uniref:poly-beta-1,6 N-acetyl-D-glucosamine export porin PgaA n=1 Tax=Acinetobacter sp. TaxID=472 RepID=UPI0031D56F68
MSVLPLILPAYTFAAVSDIDHRREAAVVLVQQGQVDLGLSQLKKLLEQYPDQQKILADYWVIAVQQRKLNNVELNELLPHIQIKNFPSYAYLSVIRSLRDQKRFNEALALSQQFDAINPSVDLKLMQGVLLVELKRNVQASQQLKKIPLQGLNANQLSLMSYAYRQNQNNLESLKAARAAYMLEPTKSAIQEEYVQALLAMGSLQQAQTVLQQTGLGQTKPQLYEALVLKQFSQNIRDAISRYSFLSGRGESDTTSFAYLDEVLASAPLLQSQFPINSETYLRLTYDYIYALDVRGRAADAVAQMEKLPVNMMQMPIYVRQAIADSYLDLKQPDQAERWYKSVLPEKKYANMSVYSGLYYAYLEQEKYPQAEQLLKDIDSKIAMYQYSNAVGVDRTPTADRQEYIRLKGMHLAYGNRLAKAEKYYRELLKKSPNNTAYLNSLATILRWREQPLAAQATLARLNGITPIDKSTRINRLQISQALGDISKWHEQLDDSLLMYPQDTSVINNRKEWNDRSHASIRYQTDFGHSRADQASQSLKGTRDRNAELRVNSPWLNDNYRVFALHQDRTGDYRDGNQRDQRYGLGLEWASKRKDLTLALTQNTRQEKTGLSVNWSQWLNDHWQYGLGFNSQAQIPLQAVALNQHGQQYAANVLWQQNESRKVRLGYQLTDISDGNQQQEWFLNYTQRLFSSPHHTTQATLSNYFGQNSLQKVSYFSPKNQYGSDITIAHDWLTWRKYNQDFTQHFEAGAGFYHQQGYSTKPTWSLQYTHQWSLSRTWKLNYGVGVSGHPYDGNNERRVYGLFGFQGIF